MTKLFVCLLLVLSVNSCFATAPLKGADTRLFTAHDSRIQYTGRVDFNNPLRPRIWAPGVYIRISFNGTRCTFLINDEASGKNHNYLEIVVDGKTPRRIKLSAKVNEVIVAEGLADTAHTVLICKDTESNVGYIDFLGVRCKNLLKPSAQPDRKIEYFGDSITSGTGMDLSAIPCGKGEWYDEHNAYMSYGAQTSRNLNAQWQLTALAGVGLVHSCCQMNVVMPQIYDKLFLRNDSLAWNFSHYQPDVLTICLGQNDGVQDSTLFCNAYVKLIDSLRQHYPNADIVCLTSPMADAGLTGVLKRYIASVTAYLNAHGDSRVSHYFFSRSYNRGCGGHPDLDDHQLIAAELTAYIKKLKGW